MTPSAIRAHRFKRLPEVTAYQLASLNSDMEAKRAQIALLNKELAEAQAEMQAIMQAHGVAEGTTIILRRTRTVDGTEIPVGTLVVNNQPVMEDDGPVTLSSGPGEHPLPPALDNPSQG